MRPKIWYLHREERKNEEQIDSRTRAVDIDYKKNRQCHKFEATRCLNFQRGSICQNGGKWAIHFYITNESVEDGNSSTPSVRNTQKQEILKVREYKQFLLITTTSCQRLEFKHSNLQELW